VAASALYFDSTAIFIADPQNGIAGIKQPTAHWVGPFGIVRPESSILRF